MHKKYPEHLLINNRKPLSPRDFHPFDKLFRGFDKDDIDEIGNIVAERIKFPDFSCNWERFSKPEDVRFRIYGRMTDGCYSFTVGTSRYKNIATPVHDPICDTEYENYSHIEVRVLRNNENIYFEPPKKRKLKSKSRKLEYRQNIVNNLTIELDTLM